MSDRFHRLRLRSSGVRKYLKNPYFSRNPLRQRRTGARRAARILPILGIAAIPAALLLVPIVLTHPAFLVTDAETTLTGVLPERATIVRARIETALGVAGPWGLSRRNFFLLPLADIERAVRDSGPVSSVQVERRFPNRLTVTVGQSDRVFILTVDGVSALIDGGGVVQDILSEGSASGTDRMGGIPSTGHLIPIEVEGMTTSSVTWASGSSLLSTHCATLISALDAGLRTLGIPPAGFSVSGDGTEVRARMDDAWTVIADPVSPADEQIERLAALLRDPRYKDRRRLDYIDIRFPDRVYVKLKGV